MKIFAAIFIFSFFSSYSIVFGEFFSAISELENILQVEHEIARDLQKYIKQEEQRLKNLKRLADDFEKHSVDGLSDPELFLGNPVNAFLLIKRFTNDWDFALERQIKPSHLTELLEAVNKKSLRFPTEEDLQGAGKALMRLQDTYALPSHRFSSGQLTVNDSHTAYLTADDCIKLGSIAYSSNDYYHTILWMDEALRLTTPPHPNIPSIIDHLAFSYYKQGNIRKALNLTLDLLRLEPDHIRAQSNVQFYRQLISEEEIKMSNSNNFPHPDSNPRPMDEYKSSLDFTNYEKLCRREETHPQNTHNLHCFYMRHHPYLFLRPQKTEEVHHHPTMYLFHDVVSDRHVDAIKETSKPKLGRSVVYHKSDSSSTTVQDYRVSKSGWLKDWDNSAVKSFSFMSSILSNLTLDTVEDLQVLNYGIGGHYEPHYDFSTIENEAFEASIGNRIATFICYLSDVEAGGATVFPGIGVSYWPQKGKCAFWYNLFRSGKGDLRTRHAACPVLSGIKWVSNKWFHEIGQEFIRPCLSHLDL